MTDEKNSLHGVEKMFHYFVRDVSSESFFTFCMKRRRNSSILYT